LILAAEHGHCNCIQALLGHGANINIQNHKGTTPLLFAIKAHQFNAAEMLIRSGADVNIPAFDGRAPLSDIVVFPWKWASDTPELRKKILHARNIFHLLLDEGAHVNAKTNTGGAPLHFATAQLNDYSIQKLIEAGAKINAQNNKSKTALDVVMEGDYYLNEPSLIPLEDERFAQTEALLRGYGAITGAELTELLFKAIRRRKLRDLELLLDAGANVNTKDSNGATALHVAVQSDFPEAFQMLLGHPLLGHTDFKVLNARDNGGLTALDLAQRNGNRAIVGLLTQYGAKSGEEMAPLDRSLLEAVQNDNLESVKFLLAQGADVNTKDGDGNTLLWLAVLRNNNGTANNAIIVALLEAPDIRTVVQNSAGESERVIEVAGNVDNMELVDFFLEHGMSLL
jgi:ankyrin repeat protein